MACANAKRARKRQQQLKDEEIQCNGLTSLIKIIIIIIIIILLLLTTKRPQKYRGKISGPVDFPMTCSFWIHRPPF